jgi:hypothetical protein
MLDALVSLEYLELLLDKMVGRWLPVWFMFFGCVGGGVLVHFVVSMNSWSLKASQRRQP